MKISPNAQEILKKRYLRQNLEGDVVETPEDMFRRVAESIAEIDTLYGESAPVETTTREFYQIMSCLEFLPNSPTLMNAGTPHGQLAACFVLPVEDSLPGIFEALKNMAIIHQSGGGVGFSFSHIRPRGDVVHSTQGIASGPVSFMKIFDVATQTIKQGGRRRGANMGILSVNHPDIVDFIKCKEKKDFLNNFNLSVAVDDTFMHAVNLDGSMALINPRNNQTVQKIPARKLFDLMVDMAWKLGDPGMVFMDEVKNANPTPYLGKIEATNPCGEQPLLDYESCNLGSINLVKMIRDGKIDWDKLQKTVHIAVHFLDNVIDANTFPLPEIEKQSKKTRKVGLGVMGFAEMLIKLDIAYNSREGLRTAEEVMKFINLEARTASRELGRARGSFPAFSGSKWDKKGYSHMRNATLTTIAPTGTLSIIAGVSSGIEPLFAISYVRELVDGSCLVEVNNIFQEMIQEEGLRRDELLLKIAREGSLQQVKEIPAEIKRIFVTAHDIEASWHVKMQAVFQRYVDNGVSKTVNLPPEATKEDVKNIFLLAHQLHCKGITIYRYDSKKKQVLYKGKLPNYTVCRSFKDPDKKIGF